MACEWFASAGICLDCKCEGHGGKKAPSGALFGPSVRRYDVRMLQSHTPQNVHSPSIPTELPDARSGPAVLARQAIIDHKLSIFGYELMQRSAKTNAPECDAEFLLYLLTMGAGKAIAERRMLFVHCTQETLASGHLALIDPERVVLAVALPPGIDAAGIEKDALLLAAARERGFRLAFDHEVFAPAWSSWLEHASFIRMELPRLPAAAAQILAKHARRSHTAQLIACGVETAAHHDTAVAMGVKLMQGAWFARPVPVKNSALRPAHANILHLINLVRSDSPIAEIEAVLKRDPALSFNLLRFINSSGFNLSCEITSFRHAVMILGLKKLFRWAALLLATARDSGSPSVMQTAVVRGRLMELLAAEVMPDERDNAFVVGVFSMLESMTGLPMATVLEGLALPDLVVQALLERAGPLAPFLELAGACEGADDEAFTRVAGNLQLSDRQVNMAHLHALSWAADLLA
jgi:c-di-GMP-related signal transduction protein